MRDLNPETITGTLSRARSFHSLYSILPVWNKICKWNRKKSLFKFLEPSHRPTVVYTDNLMEFGEACEDLSWNHRTSTPHRSETKWHRWKSRPTSKGRYVSSIATVRTGWKVVVIFYGMLLLSAKCPRPPARRENAVQMTIWRTTQRANNTFWSSGWMSSVFTERSVNNSSIWQGSTTWNLSRIWVDCVGEFGKEIS